MPGPCLFLLKLWNYESSFTSFLSSGLFTRCLKIRLPFIYQKSSHIFIGSFTNGLPWSLFDKPNINLPDSGARYSFNSSCDSGRASDTYAETSNSSVTSGFSNRVYSNTSNCSGDSGTHLSYGSDTNSISTP